MPQNHVKHQCDCHEETCPYCSGKLLTCEVCGLSEIELTTECPGARPSEEQRALIKGGYYDFRNGAWTFADHPGYTDWNWNYIVQIKDMNHDPVLRYWLPYTRPITKTAAFQYARYLRQQREDIDVRIVDREGHPV